MQFVVYAILVGMLLLLLQSLVEELFKFCRTYEFHFTSCSKVFKHIASKEEHDEVKIHPPVKFVVPLKVHYNVDVRTRNW